MLVYRGSHELRSLFLLSAHVLTAISRQNPNPMISPRSVVDLPQVSNPEGCKDVVSRNPTTVEENISYFELQTVSFQNRERSDKKKQWPRAVSPRSPRPLVTEGKKNVTS